jgi:hypothetical protein
MFGFFYYSQKLGPNILRISAYKTLSNGLIPSLFFIEKLKKNNVKPTAVSMKFNEITHFPLNEDYLSKSTVISQMKSEWKLLLLV